MIFKPGELKLLFPFYLYYFILGLSGMIFPFMVIYFVNLGFSFFQISILLAAYSVSMFVFEIPTGAFADGFSRKYSVVLGFIICGLAVLLIGFTSIFWVLFFLFVFVGLGMTLISGSEESWVIDNLNFYNREDLHKEFFIKSQSILSFAGIFAPLIGAFIVGVFSIKPLWVIWGVGFLLASLLLAFLAEEKYVPKKLKIRETFNKSLDNMKVGLKFAHSHNNTKYLILSGIFLSIMMIDADFWQPFLADLQMPIYLLGIVFSIISAVSMVVPFTARYLAKYKIKNVLISMVLLRILVLSTVLFLYPGLFIWGIAVFIFSEGLISLRHPVIMPYFQKHLPKHIRATISSIKSMGVQLGFGLGLLIFGFLADIIGVQFVIPLTGVFGLVAIYFFLKLDD
jgi:MFS family permease